MLRRFCAQRIQSLLQNTNILRGVQFLIQCFPFNGHTFFSRHFGQAFQAVIDRRKQPSIRRGIDICFHRQCQRFTKRSHAEHLRGKCRRNHVESINKNMLSLEYARTLKPHAHFPRDILRIRQFSRHALLIRRIDTPDILQLFGSRVSLSHFFSRHQDFFRRQFASFERSDDIGNTLGKTIRRVFCRTSVYRQLLLVLLNQRAENHALSALIKNGSFRKSRQFKHT